VIEFRRILCPVDFSNGSMRALTYAMALATWYNASLDILHVVPAFEDGHDPRAIRTDLCTGRTSVARRHHL
jgi:nucleotide-binding universal stress UspA family protein